MKINRSELLVALERVRPGLARKEMIEQSTSFAFVGGRVVTYNDEISVSHPVKLDITGAVKAEALYEFLSRVDQDEVDIECEGSHLRVKAGRSVAKFVFEQEIKLPLEEVGEVDEWYDLPPDTLEALRFCHPCCAYEMSRPALTCVHVRGKFVEASDSYQIVRYNLSGEIPGDHLIPAGAVRELVKYNIGKMAQGRGWLHFRAAEGTILSTRVMEARFPNIEKYLQFEGVKVELPGVLPALEKAEIFARSDLSTSHIPVVTVEVRNGRVLVTAKNEYGQFEDVSKTTSKDVAAKFTTGVEFLANMLQKVPVCTIGSQRIKFEGSNWVYVAVTMAEDGE